MGRYHYVYPLPLEPEISHILYYSLKNRVSVIKTDILKIILNKTQHASPKRGVFEPCCPCQRTLQFRLKTAWSFLTRRRTRARFDIESSSDTLDKICCPMPRKIASASM